MLEESVPSLQQAAAAKGWQRTVERDFQRAVESVSGVRSGSLPLAHWPAVGLVDVVLSGNIGLELKWCKSGDTLGNCAWDAAKLACAVAEGRLAEGLMAAGAPMAHWQTRSSGVDLFAPRVYESRELVREYDGWWRFWCKDVATRPVELPRALAVLDEGSVSTQLDGVPFVLRLARVEVVDGSWERHVCPHRLRGERCPPRPWDREGWGGLKPVTD